jgi:hypothetical protein
VVDCVRIAFGDRILGDFGSRLHGEALMPRSAEPQNQAPSTGWTVSVPALIKYVGPLVLMPFAGWVWHTESTLTVLTLQVQSLEKQVGDYQQVERNMSILNTRLEDIQRQLDKAP